MSNSHQIPSLLLIAAAPQVPTRSKVTFTLTSGLTELGELANGAGKTTYAPSPPVLRLFFDCASG